MSPLQKALVVKLVKRNLKAILLAIGDGANDVSMIQAAHVGVGISGVEGLQAARSADIAIGQFRYLRKLLLVHGAWSYQRVSKVILYSFYKNIALFMTQFWYAFQNGFSGQIIYESWTLTFYNVFFTALPPFVLGIFDQFVSARLLDRYPQLYQLTQTGAFFRMHSFWSWVGNGFYHSLILYFASQAFTLWDWPQGDGQNAGHWVWGTALYTAALATVLLKAALITNIWTKYTVMAIPGSMALWFILMPIYATVAPKVNVSLEYIGVIEQLFPDPKFWAMLLVLPPLCLIRDFAWKYAKRMYWPQSYHHVQEIQKYNIQDYRPRYVPIGLAYITYTNNRILEWSNSKKRSGRSGKCSACANNVATRSHKQMRVKRVCCKRTILQRREGDMVRWLARGDELLDSCNVYYRLWVMAFWYRSGREMKARPVNL